MAEFFDWVANASPWLWLALGILLIAVEILAPSFVVIWPGLAAFCMALLTWLIPSLSGQSLIAIFAGLAIVLLFGGRALMARVEQDEPQTMLNARGKSLIGRDAKVLSVNGAQGKVQIDGVQWPATWEDVAPEVDQWVQITEANGVNLRGKVNKT
ncbi:MAG: NfeD family protein [Rhodobacteraceae bacterium]|nr:NfeD family protein [Paracoccaceae bacterium]